jgi:hypothetical protein
MWVAGIRKGILYKVQKRPLDPRWSSSDIQAMLGLCATGQHIGWTEERAFRVAEAIILRKRCVGIVWADDSLQADIKVLTGPLETT